MLNVELLVIHRCVIVQRSTLAMHQYSVFYNRQHLISPYLHARHLLVDQTRNAESNPEQAHAFALTDTLEIRTKVAILSVW